jgi:glycosyltransferase involved in cell wall biosynthesis
VHVGLNLVFLVPGKTGGMETFARGLAGALVRERPDWRFTAFVNRETAATGGHWSKALPTVTVPVHATRRVEWVLGEQLLLPRLAARSGVDLLHSLGNTAPARGRFRRVVTIHDLIFQLFPETHPGLASLGLRVLVPLAARSSHRVMVDSRTTRDDVVRLLRVPAGKVDVVYPGHERPEALEPLDEATLRRRYELDGRRVVLEASGYKAHHKNLGRLLEALALVPGERRPVLVLTGAPTEHERELREIVRRLGLEPDTRFTGWIASGELEGLYRIAACLVFPSLYEGFGLPVIEAMARGVPVACSGRGAIAEAAGDAALLLDPESPAEIAQAIETILGDEREAERLRDLGLTRASAFSWKAAARATLACYERALSTNASPD